MKIEPQKPDNQPRPVPYRLDAKTHERVTKFLNEHYSDPMVPVYAEFRFYWSGLISVLEESGILEKVDNPNPIDIRTNEDEHDQWWKDHPEVSDAFNLALSVREERITMLYLGALLSPYLRRVDPESKRINDSQ